MLKVIFSPVVFGCIFFFFFAGYRGQDGCYIAITVYRVEYGLYGTEAS